VKGKNNKNKLKAGMPASRQIFLSAECVWVWLIGVLPINQEHQHLRCSTMSAYTEAILGIRLTCPNRQILTQALEL
jgi:hypothetical protein